ncbi:MAG: glycosyltransferase family 2 protein [Geminicoccaceae bacterium]|nr:glycosyltransferase family 2 protein [Geminicoccaceae bacterium]
MTPDLSIIVPLYNEEDNVKLMYEAIRDAVAPIEAACEIVFVDDGSRDDTFGRAIALPRRQGNVHLRVVKLRKNAGQTNAMVCGIDQARGRVLLTMDGDLQNDPRDIPLFLEKIDEGYDLVVGWRFERQDHWSRVIPSKVANRLIGKVTGVPIKDNGCSLKAYRAEVIKAIPLYAEMHRFIPAMCSLGGAKIAEIKVRHHARRFGSSKYGFSRIYKVFLDLIAIGTLLSFNRRPAFWLGAVGAFAGAVALLALVAAVVYGQQPPGIVLGGVAVLLGSLAIFLLALGLLNHLVYSARIRRFDPFRRLATRRLTPALAEPAP